MGIKIDIKKKFDDFSLNISFEGKDEILALWGPSGSGKSLTLKCIAGIEKPDEGIIVIGDKVVFDSKNKINLKPQDRGVGLLFQDYALFPNMTVRENIEIANKTNDVGDFIKRFKLEGLENLYPYQLSGGQKQRCAIARMLITNPELIMLDEAFNALDSKLKDELKIEVKDIITKLNKPTIIVSHDEDEISFFTEHIVKMG